MISLIASVGKNREIGKAGGLAFAGKGELGYFRDTTMGHKILMGRKTYESLPRRLAGREYFVVSEPGDFPELVNVVDAPEEFLARWRDSDEELFVIGGGMMYRTALPYAERLYLTEIEGSCAGADVFFPEFDSGEFDREFVGEGAFDDGLRFERYIYSRRREL